jgi:hypothetical protein
MADNVDGRYIYVLDDDDFLLCPYFIAEFKQMLQSIRRFPEIVIVKGWILEQSMPKQWEAIPKRGQIGAPNFIAREDIFKKFAKHWKAERAGDWGFIYNVIKANSIKNFFWWDKYVFYADPSVGKSQEVKDECRKEVFKQ